MTLHVSMADLTRFRADIERWISGQFDWWRDRMTHVVGEITRLDDQLSTLRDQVINMTEPIVDLHTQVGMILSEVNAQNSSIGVLSTTWEAYKTAQAAHDAALSDGGDAAAAKAQLQAAEDDLSSVVAALGGTNQRINDLAGDMQTQVAAIAPPPTATPVDPTLPTQDGATGQTQVQPPVAPGGGLVDVNTGEPVLVQPGTVGTPVGSGNDNVGPNAGGVDPSVTAPADGSTTSTDPSSTTAPASGDSTSSTSSTDTSSTSTDTSSTGSGSGSSSGSSSSSTDSSGSSSSSSGGSSSASS